MMSEGVILHRGNTDTTPRPTLGVWITALALAFLVLPICALERPALAASDFTSCRAEAARNAEMLPKCDAMHFSAWIRASLMVGDEGTATIAVEVLRLTNRCADADDVATCLSRQDAVAGWTADEARRAADKEVPSARQCFLYRTEALREARAANDYQRIQFLERDRPCSEEEERSYQRMYQKYGRRVGLFPAELEQDISARDELNRLIRESEEKERHRPWLERAMRSIDEEPRIADAIVILIILVGWAEFGMFPRTRYGLWWRRSWPKILIVGGAGIVAWEGFGFLQLPSSAYAEFMALGAMMIVMGALNLKRARTTTGTTEKPSAQGTDADQRPK